MNQIEKLTNELSAEMDRVYADYSAKHEEFRLYIEKHHDKKLDKEEVKGHIETLNGILQEIIQGFAELYPAFQFIAVRHQYVNNAINSYNTFIEGIKNHGATQNDTARS